MECCVAENVTIQLRFDELGHESAEVVEVAPNRFRLEHTPLFPTESVYQGDVIEVEDLPDGTYRFLRIVELSPLQHFTWMVPRVFVQSPEYEAFGAAVEAVGGAWEGIMGGVLHVHLPPVHVAAITAELDHRIAAAKAGSPEA